MSRDIICLYLQIPFLIEDVRSLLGHIHIEDTWIIGIVTLWLVIGACVHLRLQARQTRQRERNAGWIVHPAPSSRQR
jgi:hypothetical protein